MQIVGVLIDMSITAEQLEKRRRLTREKYEERLRQQRLVVTEAGKKLEKRWKRRGVSCEKRPGLIEQVRRMVRTETSAIVPEIVQETRTNCCRDCEHVSERQDGELFCECCGCPAWMFKSKVLKLTQLHLGSDVRSKNWHAQHACPAPKPKFGVYEKGKNNGHTP